MQPRCTSGSPRHVPRRHSPYDRSNSGAHSGHSTGSAGSVNRQTQGQYRRGETSYLPGMTLTDLWFDCPLDYNNPKGEWIKVFVREVVSTGRERSNQPALLYLEGGPGFPAPRPVSKSGWLHRSLEEYRVYLLDERGTGNSTPVTHETLSHFPSPQQQAAYLMHFRADSIIRDCERIRSILLNQERWTVLGQSYGGFLIMRYLSEAPHALEAAIITGGLPPLQRSAEEVYRATFRRVMERNRRFYERYPGDVKRVQDIVRHLHYNPTPLPSGGLLTARRFLQLGMGFGMASGFEYTHYLIEQAFLTPPVLPTPAPVPPPAAPAPSASSSSPPPPSFHPSGEAMPQQASLTLMDVESPTGMRDMSTGPMRPVEPLQLSYQFLRGVESGQSFELNPLYALLHESIYCTSGVPPSMWAAERVIRGGDPMFVRAFDYEGKLHYSDGDIMKEPILFTGEMVFSWMFEDYEKLRPLRDVANLIANKDDWPPLYSIDSLKRCDVPCAAAVYYEDMYVESRFSEETANVLPSCKIWLTNEYQHSGLRDDGYTILNKLFWMVRGGVAIPS
ncbi:unnamed protein product [Vitrella brassicaformis CCMP3155]|uniref:AB hydrolase-1 domain-containing protein n=1 Tax=Vitrella brassicaformis (strain CCMP3155) TaxID=1169540 RepID=A0A0G4FUJ8_VITBC|nr:unnamed protein product [Vitrella brassicaformis CCMP3155]|eukprot:CEM18612.1 unnamed protein product [Vitrella brassicaformis CCMP3155]